MTYSFFIHDWRPASLNSLSYCHWRKRVRIKKADKGMIFAFSRAVPKAEGKRRVSVHMTLTGRQKQFDDDNLWKSLLDALTANGLLVDDSREWCELGPITYSRDNNAPGTRITLEEVI